MIGIPDPFENQRTENAQAAFDGLEAASTTLAPQYEALRHRLLGHTGLDSLSLLDRRQEQIRSDIDLLKGFAQHLPPEVTRGTNSLDGGTHRTGFTVSVPDLATVKMVESLGIAIPSYYGDSTPSTIAYQVGEQAMTDRKHTWLLLVTPPATERYRNELGSIQENHLPARLWAALVRSATVPALHEHSAHILNKEYTLDQARALQDGKGGFVFPAPGVSPVTLSAKGTTTGNAEKVAKQGVRLIAPSYKRNMGHYGNSQPLTEVGPDELRDGLEGWGFEQFLINLAAAFGKNEQLKQLLDERQAKPGL